VTTAGQVSALRTATQRAVALAQQELAGWFGTIDLSTPERVRDGLLEVVPVLVDEFGDVAATAAAEWYEQVRRAQVGGEFYAQPGDLPDVDAVRGSVRWAAGELWGDDPLHTLDLLNGALQRHITYSSRETVARNAFIDPARPRAARVPSGAVTCAFCLMLASRGFVYHTKQAAGRAGNDYHDDCDCQIVMSFDRQNAHIEGYDPDRLYDMYQAARRTSGSENPAAIAAELRRLFPDDVSDAVHDH